MVDEPQNGGEWLTKIRKEMHYPECWDTTAYPSVWHALYEMVECSECKAKPHSDSGREG